MDSCVSIYFADCVLYGSHASSTFMSPSTSEIRYALSPLCVLPSCVFKDAFSLSRGVEINPRIPKKLARAHILRFVIGRVVK